MVTWTILLLVEMEKVVTFRKCASGLDIDNE